MAAKVGVKKHLVILLICVLIVMLTKVISTVLQIVMLDLFVGKVITVIMLVGAEIVITVKSHAFAHLPLVSFIISAFSSVSSSRSVYDVLSMDWLGASEFEQVLRTISDYAAPIAGGAVLVVNIITGLLTACGLLLVGVITWAITLSVQARKRKKLAEHAQQPSED